jgi:membrane associated rhomboid family serine protease
MTQPSEDPAATGVPTCYRHPGRETWIRCQRCERPICPDCMRDAAVGFQCPDCVREASKGSRQNKAMYGGERSADPRLTTYVLIGVNALVWLAITATGGNGSRLLALFGLTPDGRCELSDGSGRYYPGVGEQALCSTLPSTTWHAGVADGAWWQLLTSAFTHVEVWHVAMNMFALFIFGPALEGIVGRARFLAVYLVAAVGGSVGVMLLSSPDGSTVGASGALFGLLGALLVVARKARLNSQALLQNLMLGVAITVYGLLVGGISWQGHLGGFVAGAAAAAIIAYAPRAHRSVVQWAGLGVLAAVLLVLAALRAGVLG